VSQLFDDVHGARRRDAIPGALSVLPCDAGQEGARLPRPGDAAARRRVELSRHGTWHGTWVELEAPEGGDGSLSALRERWRAGRPIVLRGAAREELDELRPRIAAAFDLYETLSSPGALRAWLRTRAADLPPGFSIQGRRARPADPRRDIEKVRLSWQGAGRRGVRDLWLQSGALSAHPEDPSLRLRLSWGHEGGEGGGDSLRPALLAELWDALLPESRAASANPAVVGAAEALCGEELFCTQPSACWSAPEGGAPFRQDFLAAPLDGSRHCACWVQLAGRTAWLALSLEDLAARVRELAALLRDGGLPRLRAELFPREGEFRRFLARAADADALLCELALPGRGSLGRLVDRGPELTAFLAGAGHAALLDAGDALLLPDHGRRRRAVASLFCASDLAAYALSMELRAARPAPPPPPEPEAGASARPDREEIRRLRRASPRRRRPAR